MLLFLLAPAFAGGTVGITVDGVALEDRVASRFVYVGALVGPSLTLDVGQHPQVTVRVGALVGSLTAPAVGRRRFTVSSVDPVTEEPSTGTLLESRTAGQVDLHVAAGWAVGGVRLGPALRARATVAGGVALSTWAATEVGVGLGLELPLGQARLCAQIPLATVVTRFPWSMNPIVDDRSLIGGFFASGTRLAGPWTHAATDVEVGAPLGPVWLVGRLSGTWDAVPAPLWTVRAGTEVAVRW